MTVAIRQLAGLSPAEAALYAAEHAPRGAAVDVPLTAGERLDIRLGLPTGKRPSGDLKLYSTDDGEDGITAAPAAGRYLAVKLRHVGHGASDAAPLTLNLPTEVAIIIIPAGSAVLLSERPDDRTLIVEARTKQGPQRGISPNAESSSSRGWPLCKQSARRRKERPCDRHHQEHPSPLLKKPRQIKPELFHCTTPTVIALA